MLLPHKGLGSFSTKLSFGLSVCRPASFSTQAIQKFEPVKNEIRVSETIPQLVRQPESILVKFWWSQGGIP